MSDLTAKQEAFCLAFIETGNASEAYRRSSDVGSDTKPESIWVAASKIMSDPKVRSRVSELQAEARQMAFVSVATLTQELEDARVKAMADEKGASAAVSASMGKAKLHGLLVEKVAHQNPDGSALEQSPREVAKAIAYMLNKAMTNEPSGD